MVVEEEDTTREVRRLESTLSMVVKLMEENVQRAQREHDLVESNAQDLEYQKGILSEQLATMFEKLWGSSEQLECSFEQLTSLSEQLERKSKQLRNVSEQRKGMADQRICFALLNSLIVADDRYACRARHRAR